MRNAEYKQFVEYSKTSKTNVRKFTFTNRIAPAWNALLLITKSATKFKQVQRSTGWRPKIVSEQVCL